MFASALDVLNWIPECHSCGVNALYRLKEIKLVLIETQENPACNGAKRADSGTVELLRVKLSYIIFLSLACCESDLRMQSL